MIKIVRDVNPLFNDNRLLDFKRYTKGAIFKTRNGESGKEMGMGMGNGKSLKAGIFLKRQFLKQGIFKSRNL